MSIKRYIVLCHRICIKTFYKYRGTSDKKCSIYIFFQPMFPVHENFHTWIRSNWIPRMLSSDVVRWFRMQHAVYNSLGKLFASWLSGSFTRKVDFTSFRLADRSPTSSLTRWHSLIPDFEIGTHQRLSIVLTSSLPPI